MRVGKQVLRLLACRILVGTGHRVMCVARASHSGTVPYRSSGVPLSGEIGRRSTPKMCRPHGYPGSNPGTGTECVEAVSGCRWGKPIRKDDRLKPGREVTREGRLKNEASVHAYSTHS